MLDRQIVPPSSMMSPVCTDKQLAFLKKPQEPGPLFGVTLALSPKWEGGWVASAGLKMSRHDRYPVTALPSSILHGTRRRDKSGEVSCCVADARNLLQMECGYHVPFVAKMDLYKGSDSISFCNTW
jgi:hypothetical protein